MIRFFFLASAAVVFAATTANAQQVFDEAVDGDLSFTVPAGAVAPITPLTTFTVSSAGALTVSGATIDADQDDIFAPGGIAGDFDVFGISVAPGFQIDSVTLDAFGGDGAAFVGLVEDTTLSINPSAPGNADFDTIASGFTLIDVTSVGGGILDDLILGLPVTDANGVVDNAPAFPLAGGVIGAGDFVFSVQNTGPATNTYTVTFNASATAVPEPSSAMLLSLAGLCLVSLRRRK